MYTPERSPTIAAGSRGQHSASILLSDEEHHGKDTLNPDYDGPAKYDTPTPDELANTQKIDAILLHIKTSNTNRNCARDSGSLIMTREM